MSQYLNMGIPWRFPWPRVVFCMEEASPGPSEGGENKLAGSVCRDARLVRPLRLMQQEWNILGFMSVFEWTHEPYVPTFSAWEASPGPSKGGENELVENRSQLYCKLISAILRAKMGEIARQNG